MFVYACSAQTDDWKLNCSSKPQLKKKTFTWYCNCIVQFEKVHNFIVYNLKMKTELIPAILRDIQQYKIENSASRFKTI